MRVPVHPTTRVAGWCALAAWICFVLMNVGPYLIGMFLGNTLVTSDSPQERMGEGIAAMVLAYPLVLLAIFAFLCGTVLFGCVGTALGGGGLVFVPEIRDSREGKRRAWQALLGSLTAVAALAAWIWLV